MSDKQNQIGVDVDIEREIETVRSQALARGERWLASKEKVLRHYLNGRKAATPKPAAREKLKSIRDDLGDWVYFLGSAELARCAQMICEKEDFEVRLLEASEGLRIGIRYAESAARLLREAAVAMGTNISDVVCSIMTEKHRAARQSEKSR